MPYSEGPAWFSLESPAGTRTDPPAATDAVHYHRLDIKAIGSTLQRPIVGAHVDRLAAKAPPNRHATVDYENEIKAATAAGTPPELANFWKASGLGEVINAGVSVVYTPVDNPAATVASLSVRKEIVGPTDRIPIAAYGVRFGNIELAWDDGDELVVSAQGLGAYVRDAPDTGDTHTVNTGAPLVSLDSSAPMLLGAYAVILRSIRIRIPIVAVLRRGRTGADVAGYIYPVHLRWPKDRAVEVELVCEAVNEAAHSFLANWEAGTAIDTTPTWAAGARKLAIALNDVIYSEARELSFDEDLGLYTVRGTAHRSGATPSIALTYT